MSGTVCSDAEVYEFMTVIDTRRDIEDIVALDTTITAVCTDTGMQAKTVSGAIEKLVACELIGFVKGRG